MSHDFIPVLLFLLQAGMIMVGWWLQGSRKADEKNEKRMDSFEQFKDRTIGWVKGAFGVDLNGD